MGNSAPFETYPEFVSCVLEECVTLLPEGVDAKVGFSGCSDADFAKLKGSRALYLEQLGEMAEQVTGVDLTCYKCKPTLSLQNMMLAHSAYAKNIRRWLSGTLPRKKKARSDFVLLATCWLFGWGDASIAASNVAVGTREAVLSWSCIENAGARDEELEIVKALWKLSTESYSGSMAQRRV